MKKLLVLALAVALTPMAAARVWINVYRCDGQTPLAAADSNHPDVYRDIMVGTRLTLVVSSDSGDYWIGTLKFSWDDAQYAGLKGRGLVPPLPGSAVKFANYKDSCLDAAGTKAYVRDVVGSHGIGLELRSDHTPYITGGHPAFPGDWFVVDYYAKQVGSCDLRLCGASTNPLAPIQTLSFAHVLSRDFNHDAVVNLKDFALLASHWRSVPNADPNDKVALDLNADDRVDVADLASFGQYWLEQTDSSDAPAHADTAVTP